MEQAIRTAHQEMQESVLARDTEMLTQDSCFRATSSSKPRNALQWNDSKRGKPSYKPKKEEHDETHYSYDGTRHGHRRYNGRNIDYNSLK